MSLFSIIALEKTLRGDNNNVFGVKCCANTQICPVKGIELYIQVADDLGVDLREGLLFRPRRAKLADIMEHVGWEREHTAKYYMQLVKVLHPD